MTARLDPDDIASPVAQHLLGPFAVAGRTRERGEENAEVAEGNRGVDDLACRLIRDPDPSRHGGTTGASGGPRV
jgi:hypothetical protein